MIRNHLKVAFRNLWIRRSTSFLNVMGLSLGLATSMLMFLWIRDEQSFDRFHEQRYRIFKVYSNMDEGQGEIDTWTGAPEPWADLLKNNLPEVEEAVVFANWEHQLEINQQKFREMGCYARPALFDVFSFQVVAGDLGTALAGPDNIVISEKLARKYFGTNWRQGGRTIGQPIQIGEEQFRVSAVFADVPFQSSLKFDFVLSMESYFRERQWAKGQWGNYNFELYTRLAPQADPETVATKMLNEVKNNTRAGYPDHGIYLHPLSELYLYSNFENGRPAGGRIDYIRIFLVASVFVLIIACINYMNLVTAQSTKRAKEVGVRKVVGSNRFGLIGQFITESLLVTLLATVFAVVTVQLLLPFFNHLTDKEIAINYGAPGFWLLLSLGSVLGIGLLAGVYPAMMMSSFKVINVLKGKLVDAWRDVQLRRGMVVLQFVLSILLLIGALVVRDQIRYFKTKDLGLNRNNVILVPMRGDMNRNRQTTREELMDRNAIASLTMTNNSPLTIYNMTSDPVWEGMQEGEESIFAILTTDHHFLTTMEIPLVQGEGFAEGMPTDSTNFRYIINEEAARVMGFEDPVGKQLSFWDDRGRIIGVVNDFHFVSLHEPIKPLILRYQPEETWYLLVRPKPGEAGEVISQLEDLHRRFNPGEEFVYSFLDDKYLSLYKAEERTSRLADIFAVIAVIISCLGLFGLAAFLAERRTKEIGIRKVLGASLASILALQNKEFGFLILLAFLVAMPLSWYLLSGWLNKFAYHLDFSWQVMALAALIVLTVAVVTLSYHSLRTALANPVEALKYE